MKSKPVLKQVEVTCDDCKEKFYIKLKSKHFPDGIHIDYFSCEHCGEKYITLVTDPELRKQIKARGFKHSAPDMKLRAEKLKKAYTDRIKEL